MKAPPFKCLFCPSGSRFARAEHPIPESLGNDDTILPPGFVCDQCNQYFGTKLEREVLASPPFNVERVAAAITTKKRKYPKYESSNVNLHSVGYWDRVIFESTRDWFEETFILPVRGQSILPRPKSHAVRLTRFMLKMGLELLVLAESDDPYDRSYDVARRCARYGDRAKGWDLAYGHYPRRRDLVISSREDELGPLETRQIYEYSIGGMPTGDRVFFFAFINHCFGCNLSGPSMTEYVDAFNRSNEFEMRVV